MGVVQVAKMAFSTDTMDKRLKKVFEDWKVVEGIMERCHDKGITSVEGLGMSCKREADDVVNKILPPNHDFGIAGEAALRLAWMAANRIMEEDLNRRYRPASRESQDGPPDPEILKNAANDFVTEYKVSLPPTKSINDIAFNRILNMRDKQGVFSTILLPKLKTLKHQYNHQGTLSSTFGAFKMSTAAFDVDATVPFEDVYDALSRHEVLMLAFARAGAGNQWCSLDVALNYHWFVVEETKKAIKNGRKVAQQQSFRSPYKSNNKPHEYVER